MRSSDSQENDDGRLEGWEDEEGSDDSMEERILIRVRTADANLYDQEEEPES